MSYIKLKMLNGCRRIFLSQFIPLNFVLILLLASCSVQKKISRSAKENVLTTTALANAHVGISIFEPATNKTWFDYQGDRYFVPASNTKIPTCYVAMKYLGDSLVGLRYEVRNDTMIVIQPSADPTFLAPEFLQQPVLGLLKKYKRIVLNTEMFKDHLGSGWAWNDYTEAYMAPRAELPMYGNVARFTIDANKNLSVSPTYFSNAVVQIIENVTDGFEIDRPWDMNQYFVMKGSAKTATVPFIPNLMTISDLLADTLGATVEVDPFIDFDGKAIYSRPTDSMLRPMMYRSDNFFAEQSLLMASIEKLGFMDDAKIIDTILKTDFSDLPQRPRWVDGSGLSRYNLFTPRSMVSILTKMKNEFGMDRIHGIFPTGGKGTITSYYQQDSGYIYAKTGTLSGVVALSGFLYTKKNKLLIFSILVNNHHASATDIRKAMEKFLVGIRRDY